jgi:hypothetical protein
MLKPGRWRGVTCKLQFGGALLATPANRELQATPLQNLRIVLEIVFYSDEVQVVLPRPDSAVQNNRWLSGRSAIVAAWRRSGLAFEDEVLSRAMGVACARPTDAGTVKDHTRLACKKVGTRFAASSGRPSPRPRFDVPLKAEAKLGPTGTLPNSYFFTTWVERMAGD